MHGWLSKRTPKRLFLVTIGMIYFPRPALSNTVAP